ncbi:MAG: carbohydrate kinase family protein [Bacteroidota bacterium]
MSKLLVIGHTVLDEIYYKDNRDVRPGGIFHTVNTLANIKEKNDDIYLVTLIPHNNFELYDPIYSRVNLDLSTRIKNIPKVSLTLHDNEERQECHHHMTDKIVLPMKINYKQFNSILINMISGYDISIDDIKWIRKNSACPIYFDVHTLARGHNVNGVRNFKQINNIDHWLRNIDIIQMNENELWTLFGKINESEIIKKIFSYGVEIVIITKGANGAEMFKKNGENIKVKALDISAINTVGCGDTFGAAFLYNFTKYNDPIKSFHYANIAAGMSTTYKSLTEYERLKDDITKRFN